MASKDLKTRTRICTTIDDNIYKALKEYSSKTDIPITKIFDKAITMYLECSKDK